MCADDVEEHLIEAQKFKEKASKKKSEVGFAKASVTAHVDSASMYEKEAN
jgi:hypothetical protein